MAKIKTSIDYQKDLTVNIISGELTIQEILDKFENYYEGETTKQILCDFTNADWSNIPSHEFRNGISKLKKFSRKGGKTALVFAKDVDFGIGRMVEVFADIEEYDFKFKSFMDKEDAYEWLGIKTT